MVVAVAVALCWCYCSRVGCEKMRSRRVRAGKKTGGERAHLEREKKGDVVDFYTGGLFPIRCQNPDDDSITQRGRRTVNASRRVVVKSALRFSSQRARDHSSSSSFCGCCCCWSLKASSFFLRLKSACCSVFPVCVVSSSSSSLSAQNCSCLFFVLFVP